MQSYVIKGSRSWTPKWWRQAITSRLPGDALAHPRKPESVTTPLWKSQNLQVYTCVADEVLCHNHVCSFYIFHVYLCPQCSSVIVPVNFIIFLKTYWLIVDFFINSSLNYHIYPNIRGQGEMAGPYPGWRITEERYCHPEVGSWHLPPRGGRCIYIASLYPRPSVCGEEPHPTRGDPVVQNTADLKE